MKKINFQKLIFFCCFFSWLNSFAQADSLKRDSLRFIELPGIVISASRIKENILQSPVTIGKMGMAELKQSAQPSFFDAIENMKGVQMITPSLGFKVINARGFTNTTNVRFVQMVDGVDIQAPHIGAPIANALGPNDLDIAGVEIVPGSSSALYGMNAINGTANFITKDPFLYQGIDIQQKTGVNHFNDNNHSPSLFSETALRWGKAFANRFAVKVNASYTKGTDWYADSRADLNPNANTTTNLSGADNPGSDLVNNYADESPNRKTLTLKGRQYVVSRTGYFEKEMADYGLQNFKADAAFVYRVNGKTDIGYTYRIAHTNTIYQRTNRFRLDDYLTQQHGISVKTASLQLKAYVNTENTGNSYNIRSMAENVDRSFKTDAAWFTDFTNAFNAYPSSGENVAGAMRYARAFADSGRPVANTPQTNALIAKLRDINDWNIGAALRVKTAMVHAEVQHDVTESLLPALRNRYGLQLIYGFDYRNYIVVPDGNYFINPVKAGSNLTYWKAGGFAEATKYLLHNRLKINAIFRVDKNQYFSAKINPRLAVLFVPSQKQSIRVALQRGYRFPSLFEAFSNINSGGVKRVGGLPVMSNGIFENSYLRNSIDAFQAAILNDVNNNHSNVNDAIAKNAALLKKNAYTYLQPEKVTSIETGYRASFFDDQLTLDVDFYYNIYKNLMAQVEANVPFVSAADSVPYYLYDKAKQARYRLWTNSKTVSYNYGGAFGVAWKMPAHFALGANITMTKLDRKEQQDGLEDGFNTPSCIYNISFGNPALFKHAGFNINYRWQSSFLWQSSLATGQVPSYHTVDAQLQYNFANSGLNLKLGASNLFNRYYYSFTGGPSVGGLYYCTATLHVP
ncbi:TonB-dependent receptor [Foetidibacter luteolus]|uniref:TonB-dependent receptor n=1 Tax=Foetidibacter luteolus TaxID=2608880 RepID=UPI00129B43BE|nr:TonB-dependent receptor [Foetidibacter luteolus]